MCIRDSSILFSLPEYDVPEGEPLFLNADSYAPVSYTHLDVYKRQLSSRTSQLPHISLEGPKRLIGTNTVDCMKSGIVYGSAAMLDGMIARVTRELGEKPTVVATGGLAPHITKYCESEIICDNTLILKGLRILRCV